ncbi:MAG TPA: UDP-N-acetylmuramoyl-tripeptide--D-alanyl-D-alanine ligase [Roseiflexaceae bacterium]|nr:UDP-N-acetylmuramoyl-tripeptide--D-alanyl-D-alanine ligase [Roseiflexaceae bacterium]
MFDLAEVLTGVQTADSRREPAIPPALREIAFTAAAIDSREVTPGALFAALPGERTDGHCFLADVAARGARGALVLRERLAGLDLDPRWVLIDPDGSGLDQARPDSPLLIAVDDTGAALRRLASHHRGLFAPIVIGITGSVGKTSTKEVTASVLSRRYRTLKNPRSYNSEATLPVAMLQLNGDHDVAVLEMGCYGPGDIALLASIARPRLGIITNVGPSHLERMGSLEAIAATKAELVQALPPDGHAILNIDDPRVRQAAGLTEAKPFFYGLDPAADLWADEIESRGLKGISFRAHHAGESVRLNLPLLGRHSVHTALAATAAGLLLGLGWDAIIDGLRDESAQLRLLAVPAVQGATLIDDTYNASPVSTIAALNLLADLEGRRLVVLGDMLELGSYEEEGHRLVGRRAAEVADLLIVVGQRARWIADEARISGMPAERVVEAASNDEVVERLCATMRQGDYVLVKGSRGAAMEGIVAALQRKPASEA